MLGLSLSGYLVPTFLAEFLNAGNFLSVDRDKGGFCYANEVSFGKPLNHRGIGGSSPEEPTTGLEGWKFQSHPQTSLEERGAGGGIQHPQPMT